MGYCLCQLHKIAGNVDKKCYNNEITCTFLFLDVYVKCAIIINGIWYSGALLAVQV